jgi:hypothetical protein
VLAAFSVSVQLFRAFLDGFPGLPYQLFPEFARKNTLFKRLQNQLSRGFSRLFCNDNLFYSDKYPHKVGKSWQDIISLILFRGIATVFAVAQSFSKAVFCPRLFLSARVCPCGFS